jgi:KipI family sensor histidine kinase inhibitor
MASSGPAITPRFLPSGDTALVVEFGNRMDRHLSALVLNLRRRLQQEPLPGVVETVPTFRSLMIHYDPLVVRARELEAQIEPMLGELEGGVMVGQRWVFPTCYEGEEMAPDLAEVARTTRLSEAEVVRLHTSIEHLVYVIGFLPGLPYMGELPEALHLPRRTSPRIRVPAGSVAIATNQTCIYPLDSPGGWHIIGRCTVPLFDLRRAQPGLLSPGDTVRFVPVDRDRYQEMQTASANGTFDIATLKDNQ